MDAQKNLTIAASLVPQGFSVIRPPGQQVKKGVAGSTRICRDTFHPELTRGWFVGRCHMEPAGPGSREPDQR